MRYQLILTGIPFILAVACSTERDGPTGTVQTNGQTGSVGYYCDDAECQSKADEWLVSLEPANAFTPTFTGSVCDEPPDPSDCYDTVNTYCRCLRGNDSAYEVVKRRGTLGDCAFRGRGGFCIMRNSAVTACDPAEPNSCETVCADLEERYAEDASRVIDAQVRFSRCVTRENWLEGDTGGGSCTMVVRINDQCYATDYKTVGLKEESPQDCSLSDQQIAFPVSSNGELAAGGSSAGGASSAISGVCAPAAGGTSSGTNNLGGSSTGG